MIENIMNMLKLTEHLGETNNIEIAKGKYKLYSKIKDIYKQEKRRIHFKKLIEGQPVEGWSNRCNFDCFYYCYKIGLEKDITWLD